MEPLDFWKLSDELTIVQASLLLVGVDPSENAAYVEGWEVADRPSAYEAAKWAITAGLKSRKIQGRIVNETQTEMEDFGDMVSSREVAVPDTIDVKLSTVEVWSLRDWLRERGFSEGFFFPQGQPELDFLDKRHPRYAPKLAAALHAWRAMSDTEFTRNKSPKQALVKWLREHAAEFKLTDDEGKPNETGIEEIAKVANWASGGGAPRTSVRDEVPF